MLVSTNCTVVYLVAVQSIGGAELADLRLDLLLEGLKPGELVDVIGDGDRNILHSFTVTQILRG
jgi:hypothetical protein